jgi:hypothetical protein
MLLPKDNLIMNLNIMPKEQKPSTSLKAKPKTFNASKIKKQKPLTSF